MAAAIINDMLAKDGVMLDVGHAHFFTEAV